VSFPLIMQRVTHPKYFYDATGKLVNFAPSGASNDVVAEHVLLDPRADGPRSLVAGGLRPTVLNSPHLFTPPLSMTSPPVRRGGNTLQSQVGYANLPIIPIPLPDAEESRDIYALTTAQPVIMQNPYRRPG
jgi:hypothetical protein